jgi:multiple sugar transport system ATP-binding protein
VEEAADILGLTDYLKRRPRALSGGQRQRVAVGRAIVRHPKVFLFDEPLSNLDAKMRVQMRTELCQLHSRIQATMIYVTHDQVEAMTMGNRIVVMKDGEIQQADEPLTVYHKPANTFVAGFIGSPPMNLFDAHIEDGKILLQDEPVRVSEELAAKIRDAGLQKVTVGIRPQDFRLTEPSNGAYIKSKVDLIETLGAEAFVHAKLDGRTFVFQIDPMLKMQIGDNVGLTADEVKVNLYHPETGLAMR